MLKKSIVILLSLWVIACSSTPAKTTEVKPESTLTEEEKAIRDALLKLEGVVPIDE